MAAHLDIYCRSAAPLATASLVEFIRDGQFFDAGWPKLEPSSADGPLSALTIQYQAERRPIELTRISPDDTIFAACVMEIVEKVETAPGLVAFPGLPSWLRKTGQIISFEFGFNSSEEAQEMLYMTARFIAREHDGFIHDTQDEVFLDQNLECVCDLYPKDN